jgi:hypothetical protein
MSCIIHAINKIYGGRLSTCAWPPLCFKRCLAWHRILIMNCIKQGLTHCSLLYLPLVRLQNHLHFKTGIYSKYSDKLENTCFFFLGFANNICAFFSRRLTSLMLSPSKQCVSKEVEEKNWREGGWGVGAKKKDWGWGRELNESWS